MDKRFWILLIAFVFLQNAFAATCSIKIEWTAPTTYNDGTPLLESSISQYKIYRGIGGSGIYSYLNYVMSPAKTYTDSTATTDLNNCYVIKAVDSAGNESDFSKESCATCYIGTGNCETTAMDYNIVSSENSAVGIYSNVLASIRTPAGEEISCNPPYFNIIVSEQTCGNGKIEGGESCSNCPADVQCPNGTTCQSGQCVGQNCVVPSDCPNLGSLNYFCDGNTVYNNGVSKNCLNFQCIYSIATSKVKDCAINEYCINGNCKIWEIQTCGNGRIDNGENCSNCISDVPCPNGTLCQNGNCIGGPCQTETDCPAKISTEKPFCVENSVFEKFIGLACVDSLCNYPVTEQKVKDCAFDETCVDGTCIASRVCIQTELCGTDGSGNFLDDDCDGAIDEGCQCVKPQDQNTGAVSNENASVAIALDLSRSMSAVSTTGLKKSDDLKNSAKDFVANVSWKTTDQIGAVYYSDNAAILSELLDATASNKTILQSKIQAIVPPYGSTNTGEAINSAISVLSKSKAENKKYIVLASDGFSNSRIATMSAANSAKSASIAIYTIGMGAVNLTELQDVASITGGKYYSVTDLSLLAKTFNDIGNNIINPDNACGPENNIVECKFGIQSCDINTGKMGECIGAVYPATETCDEKDNDCDVSIDEGVSKICTNYSTCSTYTTCGTCPIGPTESCDGIDNDCDGTADEGCSCTSGQSKYCGPANVGTGICESGKQNCVLGKWGNCSGAVFPATEYCGLDLTGNSLDDDCDGTIDEDCDACVNSETKSCGLSDVGTCKLGTMSCSGGKWGQCIGTINPNPELCDEKDNDCDATIDTGCSCSAGQARQCGSGIGICIKGIQTCNSSGIWEECVGETKPMIEFCDGVDNDCDGTADEGCNSCNTAGETRQCGVTNAGICSYGIQTCTIKGVWGDCAGNTNPSIEICGNGLDDDCDGIADNGCLLPNCGNGKIDNGEDCANCSADIKCTNGTNCKNGKCSGGICLIALTCAALDPISPECEANSVIQWLQKPDCVNFECQYTLTKQKIEDCDANWSCSNATCIPPNYCGNGTRDVGENCTTCPEDLKCTSDTKESQQQQRQLEQTQEQNQETESVLTASGLNVSWAKKIQVGNNQKFTALKNSEPVQNVEIQILTPKGKYETISTNNQGIATYGVKELGDYALLIKKEKDEIEGKFTSVSLLVSTTGILTDVLKTLFGQNAVKNPMEFMLSTLLSIISAILAFVFSKQLFIETVKPKSVRDRENMARIAIGLIALILPLLALKFFGNAIATMAGIAETVIAVLFNFVKMKQKNALEKIENI